jgi:hypothetical protein
VSRRQKAEVRRQKERIYDGVNKKIQVSNCSYITNIDAGSFPVIGFEPF